MPDGRFPPNNFGCIQLTTTFIEYTLPSSENARTMANPFGHAIDDALADPAIELDRLKLLREHVAAVVAAQANLERALTQLDCEIKRREKQVGDKRMQV